MDKFAEGAGSKDISDQKSEKQRGDWSLRSIRGQIGKELDLARVCEQAGYWGRDGNIDNKR